MAAHTIIHDTIARHAAELKALALRVHRNPEEAFREVKACAWQTDLLRRWNFRVRVPVGGLATAFRAEAGSGGPAVGMLSEYDALPALGHGCGHNLICAAALGAGVALARALQAERRRGTVVVLGTPGEESYGGKVQLLARGALRGLDAALMAHPSSHTLPDAGCNAITRFRVIYHGKAAHAAANPDRGVNALDAVLLLFQGVNAWRQHLPESARIHAVISEGGVKPNIIPDRAACAIYLRAPTDEMVRALVARFRAIVRGAALMTGARAEVRPWLTPYRARRPNGPLNGAFLEAAEAVGLRPRPAASPGRASTDFGDVSQAMPGIHVFFGIAHRRLSGHSEAFRDAVATPYALAQMLRTAEALARVGYRVVQDPAFRSEMRQTFGRARRASPAVSP